MVRRADLSGGGAEGQRPQARQRRRPVHARRDADHQRQGAADIDADYPCHRSGRGDGQGRDGDQPAGFRRRAERAGLGAGDRQPDQSAVRYIRDPAR